MPRVVEDITDLIADTPLLKMNRFGEDLPCEVYAKLEAFNPNWSVKDRIGRAMIDQAEKDGLLKPGGTIIEPTSGNTGIGLAMVAAVRGYKCILCMPSSMSVERRKVMQALGAELVLTESYDGMQGAIQGAEELVKEIPEAYMPEQFNNPANPQVHYETTGPEIWNATDGQVDIFIAGVGTGGTISGTGKFLKEKNPDIQVIAIEPVESAVIAGGKQGPHMIQGIGAGFIPQNYDASVVDDVVAIHSDDAIATSQEFGAKEGFLVGISSGAACAAVREVAKRPENAGKKIVAVLPDIGERYISTLLFYRD